MSWKEIIVSGGATQRAFLEYADVRIAELTKVCASLNTADRDHLIARAQLAEMVRLKNLPETLRKEIENIAPAGTKLRGY